MTHFLRRFVTAVLGTVLLTLGAAAAATADGPAMSTIAITCVSPQTYTGSPLTPCTAVATSDDGSSTKPVPVEYEHNVNAGTATATANLSSTPGYAGGNRRTTFTIAKAHLSIVVTCPASVPYTGKAIEPCSAYADYGDGHTSTLGIRYVNNVAPGKALALAGIVDDPNYVSDGGGSASFLIGEPTTVTVTCSADQTYTGAPLTPCTATASAGTWSTPVDVVYTSNLNAGTATATATYAGDGTHLAAIGATTFAIAKADVSLGVSCGSVVFTGAPLTPCAIDLSSAGPLTSAISTTYTDNVNVGQGSVTVSFPGDANHNPATATGTFTITPAPVVVTVTCPPSADFTGTPLTPCTATVTGPGGLATTTPVTYTGNIYTGTATATATYPAGGNYLAGTGTATFRVIGFTLKGYYRPVDMSTATTTVWNTVKAGSTVPLKFEAFLPNGTEITSTAVLGATFTTTQVACATATTAVTLTQSSTDATGLRYDPTSGQFIQNWKTPKGATGCYQITTTTADHSQLAAFFILR